MDIKYFGTLAAAVFVLQFAFCLKKVKLVLRLLPTALLALGIAACAIIYVAASSVIAAPIIGVLLAMLLVLDGLAWLAAFLVEKYRK